MALFLPGAFPGSNRGELLTVQACRVLVGEAGCVQTSKGICHRLTVEGCP